MTLSPTSFALLGLLSVRSWTTYELANQTTRSLQYFFPRAERHLYAEIKRLADAGLAKSETTFTGKRRTTSYAITPAGRKALRVWLRTPPAPPALEAEVLARAFFADSGRQQDLLASLDVAREQAVATQRDLAAMAQSTLDGEAPFPERSSLGALSLRFVTDFHRLIERWAIWAAAEVATWEHTDGRDWDGVSAVVEDVARVGHGRSGRTV
ncbi:MAG TPA: PadR family transcriptional regulator [Acidimicrobiales bacterium]|jgi:DNA-binding PadR family transcriptional regulator|nr:PadR family transcriptional regulator [Acidimicrobiales bacterium]